MPVKEGRFPAPLKLSSRVQSGSKVITNAKSEINARTGQAEHPMILLSRGVQLLFRSIQLATISCLLVFGTASVAQQTTGQKLISSGFNPIAATTPNMVARLMSFPSNQFVSRSKAGRTYYVYADPSGCTCAYVGSTVAMSKYQASFGALPADAMLSGSSPGGSANPEQSMIDSMEQDEAGADIFAPDY
jgi:hypothetical protein